MNANDEGFRRADHLLDQILAALYPEPGAAQRRKAALEAERSIGQPETVAALEALAETMRLAPVHEDRSHGPDARAPSQIGGGGGGGGLRRSDEVGLAHAPQIGGFSSGARFVLLGPPGSGKGTQAAFIAQARSIPKISIGDIFRANVREGTELGIAVKKYMDAGDLVPDEITIGMVRNRLAEDDAVKGFLLDGFPRNVAQAEVLGEMLEAMGTGLAVALELVLDDDEVLRRLAGRRVCRWCGTIWHVDFDPPAAEGTCDRCGGELFQRDDDRPGTIRHRLEVYAEQTAPLVAYYAARGMLIGIDATGPVDDVTDRALDALRHFAD